jgi:leucyl aminopeptidase
MFCFCLAIHSIRSYDISSNTTINLSLHTFHTAIESKAISIKSTVGVELLLEKNYPQIAAVGMAAGQGREPRIVDITWDCPQTTDAEPTEVVIIGKGITFDTGGLNIKGGGGMRNMKRDMAGSAQALALALWIVETKLAVRLRLLLPIAENSISGIALRPGMSCHHNTILPNTSHHSTKFNTCA